MTLEEHLHELERDGHTRVFSDLRARRVELAHGRALYPLLAMDGRHPVLTLVDPERLSERLEAWRGRGDMPQWEAMMQGAREELRARGGSEGP